MLLLSPGKPPTQGSAKAEGIEYSINPEGKNNDFSGENRSNGSLGKIRSLMK
jgi:hypothetical protein